MDNWDKKEIANMEQRAKAFIHSKDDNCTLCISTKNGIIHHIYMTNANYNALLNHNTVYIVRGDSKFTYISADSKPPYQWSSQHPIEPKYGPSWCDLVLFDLFQRVLKSRTENKKTSIMPHSM
jgi:hypothetical protein